MTKRQKKASPDKSPARLFLKVEWLSFNADGLSGRKLCILFGKMQVQDTVLKAGFDVFHRHT